MRLDKNYYIYNFFGTDYLMPVGQNIADFRSGMRLNQSSALLLRFLREEHTFDEVLRHFQEFYEIAEEDMGELRADLKQTISALMRQGYLCNDFRYAWIYEERCDLKFQIGPLIIGVCGAPELIHDFMKDFELTEDFEGEAADQLITLLAGAPARRENGEVLIRNDELILIDAGLFYVFLFPEIDVLHELHVAKDGSKAVCYYRQMSGEGEDEVREQIFHAMRFAFLLLAGHRGLYAIHSASLLYKNQAWLFSGSSGTGKSTHVALWKEMYGVSELNGDLNLIGLKDGKPVVYGIPWCGTSQTYVKETYALGGVCFLRKHGEDYVDEPENDEAAVLLLNRMIYPVWTEKSFERAAEFVSEIVKKTKIYKVFCTKNQSAAITVKGKIDNSSEVSI